MNFKSSEGRIEKKKTYQNNRIQSYYIVIWLLFEGKQGVVIAYIFQRNWLHYFVVHSVVKKIFDSTTPENSRALCAEIAIIQIAQCLFVQKSMSHDFILARKITGKIKQSNDKLPISLSEKWRWNQQISNGFEHQNQNRNFSIIIEVLTEKWWPYNPQINEQTKKKSIWFSLFECVQRTYLVISSAWIYMKIMKWPSLYLK